MKLYWTSVEFDMVDPSSYDGCVGGFVYLFFKAKDVIEAMLIIQKAIEEEDLRIIQVEFVTPYDEIPWDSQEDQQKYDALAREAEAGDEVVWDDIFAYESKDE